MPSLTESLGEEGQDITDLLVFARGQSETLPDPDRKPERARQAALLFRSNRHAENLTAFRPDQDGCAFSELTGYIKSESALILYGQDRGKVSAFRTVLEDLGCPDYVKDYYLGLAFYRKGDLPRAYARLTNAKALFTPMVTQYGRYVESSIRGAVSACTMKRMIELSDKAISVGETFNLTLDSRPTGHRHCHVVGCDIGYWRQFKGLFLSWAVPLSRDCDVWIHCTNFTDREIEDVRESAPFAYISRDTNGYTNPKSFYTMTRFLLAAELAEAGMYESITCSDIDIYVDTQRFFSFIEEMPEGATFTSRSHRYPWRGTDAKFTLWQGSAGTFMLGWIGRYLAETYLPTVQAHNPQWWIDQFALAIIADILKTDLIKDLSGPVMHTPMKDGTAPFVSHDKLRLSKEAFALKYAPAG